MPESKSQGEEGLRRKVFCAKCGESLQADEGRGMLVKRVLPLPRLNYQEWFDVRWKICTIFGITVVPKLPLSVQDWFCGCGGPTPPPSVPKGPPRPRPNTPEKSFPWPRVAPPATGLTRQGVKTQAMYASDRRNILSEQEMAPERTPQRKDIRPRKGDILFAPGFVLLDQADLSLKKVSLVT